MAQAKVTKLDIQAGTTNTLYAAWSWSKLSETEKYQVRWYYVTADGNQFLGSENDSPLKDGGKATYSIPSNAISVKFRVRPIAKSKKVNGKEQPLWQADWSTTKIYKIRSNAPTISSAPSLDKSETNDLVLVATLKNIEEIQVTPPKGYTRGVQFQPVRKYTDSKGNEKQSYLQTSTTTIKTNDARYSFNVKPGSSYKVRCRGYYRKGATGKIIDYTSWTDYSSEVITVPSIPAGFTVCKAKSSTSVYLKWAKVSTATSYEIEYATKEEYLGKSDQSQTTTVNGSTVYTLGSLETGKVYYFRLRATNGSGSSGWSKVSSVAVGKKPSAPTTWSSTTTVIIGETLNLYWVHNSEDESSETSAELELTTTMSGVTNTTTKTINKSISEDEENKTSVYSIDTSDSSIVFSEGAKIEWRVRTKGAIDEYGDWSVMRTVNVYAQPSVELTITGLNDDRNLTSFPLNIFASGMPQTQTPIGYSLSIISEDSYEDIDELGNKTYTVAGQEVYSKYFDVQEGVDDPGLEVSITASDVNLQNNISYRVVCVLSMNSGLTAEATDSFAVAWADDIYEPSASVSVDPDSLTATIRPYCSDVKFYKVEESSSSSTGYVKTSTILPDLSDVEEVYLAPNAYAYTSTGEQVYSGTLVTGGNGVVTTETVYFCTVETFISGLYLSVYRREYDGSFTEIIKDVGNTGDMFVVDPHPALDYARYRVVVRDSATGAIGYTDISEPVDESSVVIQWDENWSSFETTSEDELEDAVWSGQMIKIPYNIDVSDNNSIDVSLVEYIGRRHPVSYYGTQVGQGASWNFDIPKDDADTLYDLRRLAIWMGDVYVREPSGSGYWASIKVSFSQTHCEVTIPVTLDITRVEGDDSLYD